MLQDASVLHRQDGVGAEERVVGIVRDHEDPHAAVREAAHPVEHRVLVPEVKARRRLVHHQEPRPLRQGPGHEHHLALSPGELRVDAVGHPPDVQRLQDLVDNFAVLGPGPGQIAEVGRPPHHHHLPHPEREGRHVRLGDVGDAAGQPPRVQPVDLLAAQGHPAPPRPQYPQDGLEQGGLAAAVGAEDADELSLGHREGHVPQNILPPIPDAQAGDLQHPRHLLELAR